VTPVMLVDPSWCARSPSVTFAFRPTGRNAPRGPGVDRPSLSHPSCAAAPLHLSDPLHVPQDVARYYDRNTNRFLLMGRGRTSRSIHRELWDATVTSGTEAAQHVDRLIADQIRANVGEGRATVVDFGCGVGGTLIHLAEQLPAARLRGVTVSPRQVTIARRLVAEAGLDRRCSIVLGDFHSCHLGVRADAVVAVESFAHGTDLDAIVSNAARHLVPGGILVVVDDFLAGDDEGLPPRGRDLVERFRKGWRLAGLGTPARLTAAAAPHLLTLEKDEDLTRLTRPGSRLRDRLVALTSPACDRLGLARVPFFGNIIGGHALQEGLEGGFIRYRLMVFRRTLEPTDRAALSGEAERT
jgi:SAM-dependent methyltransferase